MIGQGGRLLWASRGFLFSLLKAKLGGQHFILHQSQPRRRAGWWKAVERAFPEKKKKVFDTK